MAANAIKKIHVPAYCPVVCGTQVMVNSGVVEEKKNVIAMAFMPIMVVEVTGIEELVELAIAIPDIVLEAAIDIDIAGTVLVGDIDINIEPTDPVVDMSMTESVIERLASDESARGAKCQQTTWWEHSIHIPLN